MEDLLSYFQMAINDFTEVTQLTEYFNLLTKLDHNREKVSCCYIGQLVYLKKRLINLGNGSSENSH